MEAILLLMLSLAYSDKLTRQNCHNTGCNIGVWTKQELPCGWNRTIKNTATHTVPLWAMQNTKNQSGCEPLNLENGSFVKWQFWCHRLELLRNSAKPNGKRVHQQTQQCSKHSHSQSYRSVRPSYLRRWDRGNYKGSATCPITKGSNSSHFHIPLIFCPVLLSPAVQYPRFFLFLTPFLILEKKKCST